VLLFSFFSCLYLRFSLFRFPSSNGFSFSLIWLVLRFRSTMNFHRGIAQTVCDVEYVTELIRSLELRGFQPSTRPRSKWQKEGWILHVIREICWKGEGHFVRDPFSCLRVSFYSAIFYVAICCYLLGVSSRCRIEKNEENGERTYNLFCLFENIAREGEGHTGPRYQLVYVLNRWDKTPQHESGSFSSRCLGLLDWGYISSTSCISSSKCDMLIEQDGYPTWYKIRERRIVSSPHATPPSPRPV